MWTPDYYVRLVDLDTPRVDGVTVVNSDGSFDIYINRSLSLRRQRECLEHELRHVRREHFYSDRPVESLELEARGLPVPELINVFDLPDPALIPHFASLDALHAYVSALTLRLRGEKQQKNSAV